MGPSPAKGEDIDDAVSSFVVMVFILLSISMYVNAGGRFMMPCAHRMSSFFHVKYVQCHSTLKRVSSGRKQLLGGEQWQSVGEFAARAVYFFSRRIFINLNQPKGSFTITASIYFLVYSLDLTTCAYLFFGALEHCFLSIQCCSSTLQKNIQLITDYIRALSLVEKG